MKGLSLLIATALPVFLTVIFCRNSHASNTSYLITESKEIGPPSVGGVGKVLFIKLLSPIYSSGKMILSADPDGTQNVTIGDTLIIDASYPSSGRFEFNSKSNDCKNHIQMPPSDITNLFSTQNNGINNLTFRYIDWCGGKKQISPLYLVNITDESTPSPSPEPTQTPSPSPNPTPFLDLPWNYQSTGVSFEQIVFNPNSWFDHKYPLQNLCCDPPVTRFDGEIKNQAYKSHNGYDYGAAHQVFWDTEVLAAASGYASFLSQANSLPGSGNVIKIDHGNGYQTWYEHLQKNGLVVSVEGHKVFVNKGDIIGRVGMTGNTSGPHIHFSVLKDVNENGDFDDDFPYGITDPLGWEGNYSDPWNNDLGGAQSFNLFTSRVAPIKTEIPIAGGSISSGGVKIIIPPESSDSEFGLAFRSGPFEEASELLKSITPSFFLDAFTNTGVPITQFSKPIKIIYDYSNIDITNIKEETIKLYYFNEENSTWNVIPTLLDTLTNTAIGEALHFTQFSLMGETKDSFAPTTSYKITGEQGVDSWYRTNVSIELFGEDNEGGVGTQYTLYTINGDDWDEYKGPLIFEEEGDYKISYQSFDKSGNEEEKRTIEFSIDKTSPEAKIYIDPLLNDVTVFGLDKNSTIVKKFENKSTKKKNDAIYLITDLAGNTIKLDVRDMDGENRDKFSLFSVSYNNASLIEQTKNQFKVTYKEEKGKKQVKEENFTVKGIEKIRIEYNLVKNESKVITKLFGQDRIKGILPELVLLQLSTNQGNLEYSYQ